MATLLPRIIYDDDIVVVDPRLIFDSDDYTNDDLITIDDRPVKIVRRYNYEWYLTVYIPKIKPARLTLRNAPKPRTEPDRGVEPKRKRAAAPPKRSPYI